MLLFISLLCFLWISSNEQFTSSPCSCCPSICKPGRFLCNSVGSVGIRPTYGSLYSLCPYNYMSFIAVAEIKAQILYNRVIIEFYSHINRLGTPLPDVERSQNNPLGMPWEWTLIRPSCRNRLSLGFPHGLVLVVLVEALVSIVEGVWLSLSQILPQRHFEKYLYLRNSTFRSAQIIYLDSLNSTVGPWML